MTQPTYLFYDIETTGLNKCFDQVIQFAAIRTDLDLKEIDRYEFNIKLNVDVLPAPHAILTHNISIEKMQDGLNELEAMQKIHSLLNTPGTISLGYNTLGFDDEFLRFSFYRNLLPPYTHQFLNQCSRMDIYPITVLYYLFKNEALQWPKINGKTSLKLEHLSGLNQLAEGAAHDAMVDVEATLALARKLKHHEEMWQYATGYFQKNEDLARINKLPTVFSSHAYAFRQALMISGKLGSKNKYQAPVLLIGQHQHYKNQSLWLRLDQENLQATHADDIAENTYVIRKRAAEQQILLPPKERFLNHLSQERRTLANENLKWLEANPDLLQLICDYHQHYKYPTVPNIDPDAALYDLPFATYEEEAVFTQFHKAKNHEKTHVLKRIMNPIRQEQAIRILGRHFPTHLSSEHQVQFDNYLAKLNQGAVSDFRGEHHLTSALVQREIADLLKEEKLSEEQRHLLKGYDAFLSTH